MRPRFRPSLVNGRSGDPAVYVDFLLERRAVLFDLGDIRALSPRAILRLTDVFVSHAHIDHFCGFDHLLRVLVGREKRLRLFGPPGFLDRVEAKLCGYTWNLTDRFRTDLVFSVTEAGVAGEGRRALFRLKRRFRREDEGPVDLSNGLLRKEPSLSVRFAVLEHRTPCLAFALEEPEHVNVWRNRLDALGLETGAWLGNLKRAIYEGLPDDTPIPVRRSGDGEGVLPLGFLKETVVSVTPGQKIAYVTDAAHSAENAASIVALAAAADTLFIEAAFASGDSALAAERAHLTTAQAGSLARRAEARRVEPFHFSARYEGCSEQLLAEVREAFEGRVADTKGS